MTHFQQFVGLDIGKFTIAVAGDGIDRAFEVRNDQSGFDELVQKLESKGLKSDTLLVLEPSGSYETPVWCSLSDHGFTVRRIDAKQVRHFAKAYGLRAKTDPLDADLLATYARTFPDRGAELATEKMREIKALVCRRSALVENRKGVRCRLKQDHCPKFEKQDQALEALLTAQILDLDKALAEMLVNDAELANKSEKLRSIPGIGPVVTYMALAHMPELGNVSDKHIASLAGVAPFAKDIGKAKGKRFVQDGRKAFRNVLYQGALVASQRNPDLKEFAERLKKKGKPHKVIITAVARKLIILANAILKKNELWKVAV